jgi:DnaJ-class molecular chaperone
MMNTNFFANCKTQAQAISQYRRLCSKYHPDKRMGEDIAKFTAIMQEINAQYDKFSNQKFAESKQDFAKITAPDFKRESRNWDLIEKFIEKFIYTCQTSLVDEMFTQGVFDWEEVNTGEITEDEEPPEIFEWWLVTAYFAREARRVSLPVLENEYGTWWGRTCTGQALSSDNVIWEIAEKAGVFHKEQVQ